MTESHNKLQDDRCTSTEGHEWRVSIEGSYPDLEIYAYCENNDPNARKTCHLSQVQIEAILNTHAWMCREIERVGRALFTGTETGYVGTEEDLQAIGQYVEGLCEVAGAHASLQQENERLRERVKALEQNTSKSVLRRIDTLLERKNLQGQNQHQQE